MQIPIVKAVCQDCLQFPQTDDRIKNENMVGPLTIRPSDGYLQSPLMGHARGFLLMSCRTHHDEFRNEKGADGKEYNHGKFLVYDGDRLLGEMGASTEALEVSFWVKDGALRSQLSQEALGLRPQEKK